jgi:hypothetical protein
MRRAWLAFLLWWSGAGLVLYSLAGERMPWLTVHIVLPWLLTGGWGLARAFAAWRERVQASAVIHRRSGVAKWELDMRGGWAPLAAGLPVLRHLVFASSTPAGDEPLLRKLGPDEVLDRLRDTQPYGARHVGWANFEHTLASVHGWELRRGAHARQGAQALASLFKPQGPR